METSWLIARLDNPALLQKGDEQRLRELIATYPYFSAPYLLLARSLKEQNHPAFEQLLPLISLQAFDRKRLFRLIHEVGAENFLPVREAEVSTVDSIQYTEESSVETHNSQPLTANSQKQEPRFAVNFSEVEKTEEEEVQAFHEELQEIPFLMDEDEVKVEEESTVDSIQYTEESIVETDNSQQPTANSQQLITNPSEKIDFIHWLEKLQPVKKIEVVGAENFLPVPENDEKVIARHTERSRSTTDMTENTGHEVFRHGSAPLTMTEDPETSSQDPIPNPQSPIPDDSSSLIEKFIQTNPSVSRVKERFYDPAVQAKESERLDDTLITETLARIFVKQEKYERAIDAYRKLQLKYPEKSDYFAALISEINSKIH